MNENPSSGPDRRPPLAESPGSGKPDYDRYAPGVGYTPPYAPPPQERTSTAWQRYADLCQRARADSMSWWGMKALQGLLIGGGPFALGIGLIAVDKLLGAGQAWSWIGLVLTLTGLGIILRYALAPITCKWVVTVPENRYCVIEDHEGYTSEYLEPGRWFVMWRWYAKVRDYVDFNAVTAITQIANISGSNSPVIDVTVTMAFNPARAEPHTYAQLRQMIMREQFETMIARDVRDLVHRYFRMLPEDQQGSAARNAHGLEAYLVDQLEQYRSMGLSLASSRPVMVHFSASPPLQTPYPPPVVSPWAQPNPYAQPTAPQPPPDPRPAPPAAEPPAADIAPEPPVDDQSPRVKGADRVDDPLTLRRRRRDRDRD